MDNISSLVAVHAKGKDSTKLGSVSAHAVTRVKSVCGVIALREYSGES